MMTHTPTETQDTPETSRVLVLREMRRAVVPHVRAGQAMDAYTPTILSAGGIRSTAPSMSQSVMSCGVGCRMSKSSRGWWRQNARPTTAPTGSTHGSAHGSPHQGQRGLSLPQQDTLLLHHALKACSASSADRCGDARLRPASPSLQRTDGL